MSISTNIENLSFETRQKLAKDLEIKIEPKSSFGQPRFIYPFEIERDNIKIPFAYAARTLKLERPHRKGFPKIDVKFQGTPRPEQVEILKESLTILSSKGSLIISCYTGFGKTISSINLACSIGFKTLILVNKLILIKQWREAINNFCPSSSVQCLTVKSSKEDCDFYIINAQNVEKMGKHFFDDIGLVICDEVHLLMAETLSKSLQCVYPRYLLGLSATPYRVDGLDKLLELYFGKNKIVRELFREHTAYKVSTGFKPKIEYTQTGSINWNMILESQADDEIRNNLIVKIISHFKDRTFLVLVKRISQGEYLESKLNEIGENVTSLLGKNQIFDVTSRILIGTTSKVGTGFDHPKLNTLMLACDVEEYFIQYMGRIFRTKEGLPIIFDLVDNNSILNKHWNTRRKVYQDHGGTVINFDLNILK